MTFGVDSRQASYRWDIRRVGSSRILSSGAKTKFALNVHAPPGDSGVYLLEVRSRGRLVRIPFAVEGAQAQKVLVVLPLMTWLGRDPVDDDGDGAPNLLDRGQGVRLQRVLAGDGLPAGFATHEAPVLAFLDHHHKRYDVTTDVALATGGGPQLAGHTGVLLPGEERWLPRTLQLRLRSFVRAGGKVASLGTDSLLRSVDISQRGRLVRPSPPAPADLFGERVRPLTDGAAQLNNDKDDIGLFQGGTGRFDGFTAFEPTAGLAPGAQLVASAVTPGGQVIVAAVRVGKGLVIRPGLPQLPTRLNADPNVAALLLRAWTLLAH
jgi:hypothetical protein